MRLSYIIGGMVIIAALIIAMFSFRSSLTHYVTIDEAKALDRPVQVAGLLVKDSTKYDTISNSLIFKLREPTGDEMVVRYQKSKPANFENADKIVAIGRYDKSQDVFIANELLVKCPSKYEGRISEK